MSEIQVCEGIWRNRSGQRLYITQCEPDDDGQQWTDGAEFYLDDGTYDAILGEGDQDLVEYIGPFPYRSQRAPVSRPAETESTTAVAGGVSDDPGRIIYELEKKLEAAETKRTEQAKRYISTNETINDQTAEIDRLRIELQETYAGWSDSNSALAEQTVEIERLRAELQTEFAAAQQLRSENQSLTVRLQRAEVAAAEALQKWETTEQVCLRIITALAGVQS